MLVVILEREDLKNDGFVWIGCVARAIARANGSSNLAQAERKLFQRINAGVQLGLLNPLDPETMEPHSREDYGNGILPFAELVKWGQATKLWNFKSEFVSSEAVPWTNAAPLLREMVTNTPASHSTERAERALGIIKRAKAPDEHPKVTALFEKIDKVQDDIENWETRDGTRASDFEIKQKHLRRLNAELELLGTEKRLIRGDGTNSEVGKKWTSEKLADLAAYRAEHTMTETAAKYAISAQRIRELLPSKKQKAAPFSGLIHRTK